MTETTLANFTNATGATPAGAQAAPIAGVPAEALVALAAQLREAGTFLMVFDEAGALGWSDAAACEFFTKFVGPLLADVGRTLPENPCATAVVRGATPVTASQQTVSLPGAIAIAWPFIERKQLRAVFVLAARAEHFGIGEDVVRACGRLQLDAAWLLGQSRHAPPCTPAALLAQARLLPSMFGGQLRLAGVEKELNSLSTQLANNYEELSLIYQVSGGMKVNRRPDEFFRQACQDVLQVLEARTVGFALNHNLIQAGSPEAVGDVSLTPDELLRIGRELVASLARLGGPMMIHDLAGDRTFGWLAGNARQLLAVPLQRQDQTLGVLFALDKLDGEFDSVDSKLLNSIANESAIYLENARLFDDVHGLMMGLLHSLTSAVDAKDSYTCGHSERVALVSRHLAQQAGLSDRDVEQVYMAGLLHDVGKIGVPEAVLQKAGKLTNEEFELIKRHPQIGARILQDVKQLQEIIPGVLHHHERYDGKGYPAGLWGESIPLMGRIICLADCFDAMTSSRTYRKALPLEVALGEIRRCAGTQFDPRLAEFFLRTGADGFRELLREHQTKSRSLLELEESLKAK